MSRAPNRLNLFFATVAAGGGHVTTAQAMAEGLERLCPGALDIEISDFMKDAGFVEQDQQHKEAWRWMLARPWSARMGQRVLDSFPATTQAYHRRMLDAFAKRAATILNEKRPDLVVANHGWMTVALTRSQLCYGLDVPVLSFATEPLDASALWAEARVEQFVVASEPVKRDLRRMGVPPGKVDVVGYPVKSAFLTAPCREEARQRLELPDNFTCLVSLGGEGISSQLMGWLPKVLSLPSAPTVMVMTGRNDSLRARLTEMADRHANLRVEGFTNRMVDFVAASDLVIGKAGPSSVFEALAVGRPFLATGYAGLNERKVVRFIESTGLGRFIPSPDVLLAEVEHFRERPERLEAVRERSAGLDFAGMTERLARYLLSYARGEAPDRRVSLLGRGVA